MPVFILCIESGNHITSIQLVQVNDIPTSNIEE